MSSEKPSAARLASMFAEAGITLSARQLEQFWAYHRHLRARNEALNMTRIYEFEAMVVKLYIDSAIVGKLVELPSPLLDIGTGPGFPGIPLAIMHPGVQFLLSEGRHKRNEFLREVVDLLGLKNVEVLGHRIAPEYDRPVQGVITRAVETIDETLNRVLRSLQPGGLAIFMKGPECGDEMETAERKFGRFYALESDIPYRLLDTVNERRLVVYRRTGTPAPARPQGEVIRSADNARFKLWRGLTSARAVRKEGLAKVSGRAALEFLRFEPDVIRLVIAAETLRLPPEAIGLETAVLTRELFAALEPEDLRLPIVLIQVPAFASPAPGDLARDLPSKAVLLGMQDPAEVGAAVRSAIAFGWTHIGLTKEAAHPYHPEALTRAGAAVARATFYALPAAAELPPLPGGVVVRGPANLTLPGGDSVRLQLGGAVPQGWKTAGDETELQLDAGAILAAALSGAQSPKS